MFLPDHLTSKILNSTLKVVSILSKSYLAEVKSKRSKNLKSENFEEVTRYMLYVVLQKYAFSKMIVYYSSEDFTFFYRYVHMY